MGPKFTDRIMAVNMIGTKTLLMVCVLAVLLQESYLVDVAIVYALLSFLAVVVLSKLVITLYRVKKSEQKKTESKQLDENEQQKEEPHHD